MAQMPTFGHWKPLVPSAGGGFSSVKFTEFVALSPELQSTSGPPMLGRKTLRHNKVTTSGPLQLVF